MNVLRSYTLPTLKHQRPIFFNSNLFLTPNRFYTTTKTSPPKGWRKYTEQFKNKPASYITTFAIIHELTAIIPFPIVYYGLSWSSLQLPVPEKAVHEGNRIVNKVRVRYGYEPLEADNRAMVHLATTYAIVKIMLPLRIGASIAVTPFFAEKWVGPLMASMGTLLKKLKPS